MFDNILPQLGAWFVELWNLGGVKAIVAQTLFNVVLAVSAALYTDTFNLQKIGEFLYKKLLPFLAVYIVAKAAGTSAGIEWVAPIVYATIVAMLAGDMLDNLMKLGLKVPELLQRFVRTEEVMQLVIVDTIDTEDIAEADAVVENRCYSDEN